MFYYIKASFLFKSQLSLSHNSEIIHTECCPLALRYLDYRISVTVKYCVDLSLLQNTLVPTMVLTTHNCQTNTPMFI